MFYYRIYDDNEELNFFKSSLSDEQIRKLLEEFEHERQQYRNPDFVEFLKKQDVDAELIKVNSLSY